MQTQTGTAQSGLGRDIMNLGFGGARPITLHLQRMRSGL